MLIDVLLSKLRTAGQEHLAERISGLWEYPKPQMGDVAIPCFQLREEKENPVQASNRIKQIIDAATHGTGITATVAGPYVNITFPQSILAQELQFWKPHNSNGKKAVIEYSSPNVGKPFGIGHLRSTMIGASLKECYCYLGWHVEGINHIGDWGTQYGNLITAYKMWGSEEGLKENAVQYLYELYVRFHKESEHNKELAEEGRKWFAKVEQGDKEARALWKLFRDASLKEFEQIYKVLGVHFEHTLGESFYEDKLPAAVQKLKENNLLVEDQGALIVDFARQGYNDITPAIIIKTNGTSTYLLRDVASFLYRVEKFKFDKMIYEVGAEQILHFKQLFAITELLEFNVDCEHVSHGFYVLPEGKMSTRKGNLVFVEDIIRDTTAQAQSIIAEKNPDLQNKEEVARKVALAALIFQDLRQDRIKTVTFSWEKMLDFEGETGPYLQYTYARINSIMRKAPAKPKKVTTFESEEELVLVKHLLRFDDIVKDTVNQARPHILCRYLLDLAQLTNSFYVRHKVIQENVDLMEQRLGLLEHVQHTLRLGLSLLNIPVVDEM
jgi:arginyl-tRNA synthetase